MNLSSWRESLVAAAEVEHPYPYSARVLETGIPAAVLLAWGFHSGSADDPQVLLTLRTHTVSSTHPSAAIIATR